MTTGILLMVALGFIWLVVDIWLLILVGRIDRGVSQLIQGLEPMPPAA